MPNEIKEQISGSVSETERGIRPKVETDLASRADELGEKPAEQPIEAPNEMAEALLEKNLFPTAQADLQSKSQPFTQFSAKPAEILRVESILEENLADLYVKMDKATQERFKQAGEETALNIAKLLAQAKYHVKKIFDLIVAWLRIIPGLNQFFWNRKLR